MCKMQADRRGLKYALYLLIAVISIGVDQLTKYIAVLYLKPIRTYPLWDGVFQFTYVENRGAAWGMLQGQRWLFFVITVLTTAFIVWYILYEKQMRVLTGVALSLIAGGGIGNLIDRMATGAVVDFFHFSLIDFPVFNVADICVCVGAGLFIFAYILEEIQVKKQKQSESAQKDEQVDEQ